MPEGTPLLCGSRRIIFGVVTFRRNPAILFLTAALLAVVFLFLTGPRAPIPVAAKPSAAGSQTVRGAYHIHTSRSDGALDKTRIAAAAAEAGLQFAVFTDHGNGTRAPDPPAYIHGVLCIDGVEISTNDGHYVAVGMPAAPYPLGGDAEAVAEDVKRLGGFGVAAHPTSPRTELSWSDWNVPVDGLEWLNADSEWRDERRLRLARAVLDYLWRPVGALGTLLDRPSEALHRWDQLAAKRSIVALAAHDAHGGFGSETGAQRGRRLHVPSYGASFRTFSVHAVLSTSLSGDASADAESLIRAIRTGAVYSVVDAVATPASLDYRATDQSHTFTMGQVIPDANGPVVFKVRASVPPGSVTLLNRNGQAIAKANGGVLDHEDSMIGAYRVEIQAPGAPGVPPVPWLVSNPIYVRSSESPTTSAPASETDVLLPLSRRGWRLESGPSSSGTVGSSDGSLSMAYQLGDDQGGSQFVALVADLAQVPAESTLIRLHGRADRPMRLSAQLRFAGSQDRRWGRSVYLAPIEREIRISLARLRSLDGSEGGRPAAVPLPPVETATSLLFVIDLTNNTRGGKGVVTLRDVAFARDR